MTVELAAAPGRAARKAELSVKFGKVETCGPTATATPAACRNHRRDARHRPRDHPVEGEEPALWLCSRPIKSRRRRRALHHRLLSPALDHRAIVPDHEDKGLRCRSAAAGTGRSARKLVAAILIAAVKVMQLVDEREGKAKRRSAKSSTPTTDRPWRASVKASKAKPPSRRTRTLPARSPSPHGSSQGSAAGPATTANQAQSSCSEASPSSTPSSMAGASEMCESRSLAGRVRVGGRADGRE